jgi:hypothetical protein
MKMGFISNEERRERPIFSRIAYTVEKREMFLDGKRCATLFYFLIGREVHT